MAGNDQQASGSRSRRTRVTGRGEAPSRQKTLTSGLFSALALVAFLQGILGRSQPLAASAGDIVADIDATLAGASGGVSVAFDGQYLYYTNFDGTVMHRIDVPATGSSVATGHVAFPIVGPPGINAFSWDATRNMFWGASSDGVGIWLLSKPTTSVPVSTGMLAFTIDPVTGEPGDCNDGFGCQPLVDGLSYDGTDDTIWFSPDGSQRVYHYQTSGDMLGFAVLAAPAPGYFDVNVPPNDMFPDCGFNYSSGLASGGSDLFLGADGCPHYFEYTKTGTKVAVFPYNFERSEDFECDNVSYSLSVIWGRDAFDGHIRAFEQPRANACIFGGGVLPPLTGRMTGGGDVPATVPANSTVHHGLTIHCETSDTPNRLEVNWQDSAGKTHRFHMLTETSAMCSDDPLITPNPPNADFDTLRGKGNGKYDGSSGAMVDYTFKDAGEPGTFDSACIRVRDGSGATVLYVGDGAPSDCSLPTSTTTVLTGGNQQAHKDNK